MPPHVIKILAGYPKSEKLELSDRGRSEVDQGSEIEWVLEDRSGEYPGSIKVETIEKIERKLWPPSNRIFKVPPRQDDPNFKAEIDTNLGTGKKWRYNIHWSGKKKIGEKGESYKHDPIIAVKPTSLLEPIPLPRFLFGIAVGLGSIFTLQYLLRKGEKQR